MITQRSGPLPESEHDFCIELRRQLEHEANALDAVTTARLSAARHRALALAEHRRSARWLPWLGGAVAASLLLAVLTSSEHLERLMPTAAPATPVAAIAAPAGAPPEALVASDVAVIADLEFYDWLEEQDALL